MILPEHLSTKRILLRPFKLEDKEDFSRLAQNKEINRWIDMAIDRAMLESTPSLLDSIVDSYATPDPIFALAVILKGSNIFIGTCGLLELEFEPIYECFFALLPEYRGGGYAIEAMKLLFDYAFEELGVVKIMALVESRNPNAWRAAERSGMKYTGQIEHDIISPSPMYFSITKHEYDNQKHNF